MEKKIEKRFLSELPMRNYKGKMVINYEKLVGKKIKVLYDNIQTELEITRREGIYLYIKYKDYEPYPISIGHFKKCQFGALLKLITIGFKRKIGDIIKDTKRDLEITDMKYIEDEKGRIWKWYKYYCNKCNHDGWIREHALLDLKQGCARCAGNRKFEGYNDILITDPWMVKYFPGGEEQAKQAKQYTRCSGKKIKPRCPDCSEILDKEIEIYNIYQKRGISCPHCGDGFPYTEKFMKSVLEQVFNGKFIHQLTKKIFEWIGKYKYDFYLPFKTKQEYIVETDGDFHNKDNKMSGQTKEESKAIDDLKDALAEKHNIKVIRIPCYESTLDYMRERILESKLNDLFDLSNIDWEKCEAAALSNLVKKTCEMKKNNSELTTTEIAEKMGLAKSTINKYLKKGEKLGWCDYDPKQELKDGRARGLKKAAKNRQKAIEIFKDGKTLGKFDSIKELTTNSEVLFKTKLRVYYIIDVCKGRRKEYKGFTFKYIE